MKKKRIILITGAATSLAKEVAKELAKDNLVIIHYNNSEKDACNLKNEKNIKLIKADFSSVEPSAFFNSALSLYDDIDVIINAASIFKKVKIEDLNKENLNMYYNIHSVFPLLLTVEFYKYLNLKNTRGCVINITDSQINDFIEGRIPYYLSKNSLSYQTKLLASSLAPTLRVNEIAPGFTLAKEYEEKYFEKVDKVLPFNITNVLEIVNAINYFLNSEQVTGQCLKVDSGLSTLPKRIL
ncbi:MAG: SDR family NAD(P)-dependent oxidoreductase [Pleomorphochaeta sp.]